MVFAVTLLASLAVCFAARNFIRDHAGICYGMAIAVSIAYFVGYYFGFPREVWLVFFELIQKCMLALALFSIVMFMGVLPRRIKSSSSLLAIRSNLSVIAWILALAHMGVYLANYSAMLLAGANVRPNVLASFAVAIVLFVLLMVLGVTSFRAVKRRMSTASWRRLQKLAYPFFLLVYVHLIIILAPAALRGAEAACATIAVYSVVFGAYAVLRIYRAVADRREEAAESRVGLRCGDEPATEMS